MVLDLREIKRRALVGQHFFYESEMALFSGCRLKCAQNRLDTADIVREGI
jgi:hypothetical protein